MYLRQIIILYKKQKEIKPHMIRHNQYIRLLTITLMSALAICIFTPGTLIISRASSYDSESIEDPGAGRLSGQYIPDEFFGNGVNDTPSATSNDNGLISNSFGQFGSVQTSNQFTGKNYIHQNKFDGFTIINGIDVSSYQKDIDWSQVKASGIEFAFIRVGGRYYGLTSNGFYDDVKYDANMDGAAAAGIKTGIYIFSQATTTDEAVEEAQYILDRIGTHTVNMPLILDFEFASNASGTTGRLKAANLSKDAATSVCMAFCQTIHDAGYTPMVYANPDMLNNHLNPDVISASYPIWLANYTTDTGYSGMFNYWQYSSAGKVPGIEGNVDMDFFYDAPIGNITSAIIKPIPDQVFTGAAITPDLAVTMNGTALVNGIDYTAIYTDNTAIGTATITITGINGYNGTRTITFNITDNNPLPVITDLSLKTKTKNYITLKWSTASDITGYELYRASSLNGNYALIKTITKSSTGTFKNTKLTEGQCYYYKIRTYKTTNGVNSYGELSAPVGTFTKTSYTRLALPKTDTDIYAGIDVNSEVIANPEKNEFVKVTYCTLDDAGTKWYRVSYDGVSGYMYAGQVTIAKQGKVKTSKVNVRKSSKVSSKKLTTVGKNKKIAIIKTKKTKAGTWYNVIFVKGSKTYKGWIYSIYVKI